jgi:hypothetical protein
MAFFYFIKLLNISTQYGIRNAISISIRFIISLSLNLFILGLFELLSKILVSINIAYITAILYYVFLRSIPHAWRLDLGLKENTSYDTI